MCSRLPWLIIIAGACLYIGFLFVLMSLRIILVFPFIAYLVWKVYEDRIDYKALLRRVYVFDDRIKVKILLKRSQNYEIMIKDIDAYYIEEEERVWTG